ncbi:MAG: hypothetical protein FJX11_07465 [Alphaproteobacteria bacterium]|nr:hypothetical protein [Alphaproteobacteria bacterium]
MLHHVLAALIEDIGRTLLETRALLDEVLARDGYSSPEAATTAADAVNLSLQLLALQVNAAMLLEMTREPVTAISSELTRAERAAEVADQIAARAYQPLFAELSGRAVRLGKRLKHLSTAMNR